MMWSSLEAAREYIANRTVEAGIVHALSDDGNRLEISDTASVSLGSWNGLIRRNGREVKLNLSSDLEFAIFAHNVDETLIATGVDPQALSEPDYGRPSLFYKRDDRTAHLMNHLWRSETTFHHFSLPPARIGDCYWRTVDWEGGLYAAAWSVGMIKPELPVVSSTDLWMQSSRLHRFAPDLRTGENTYCYYCLERDDGYRSRLVRVVDFRVDKLWAAEELDDTFLEELSPLYHLLAIYVRHAKEAEKLNAPSRRR